MDLPEKVQINEMVLRDGLQLEKKIVSVEEKRLIFSKLKDAGVTSFEFGSFVHPKAVPQMANSGELYSKIVHDADCTDLIALVPNLRGVERAQELGVQKVNFVFSASDTHNIQNVQKTTAESLKELNEINTYCDRFDIQLNIALATTFGCPFEGEVPKKRIFSIIEHLFDYHINTITLADTTGMANPKQVFELVKEARTSFPKHSFNMHFHNTRGMGISNIIASILAGVTSFDTSLGGLGGCPFAPGATGNVCTEDVVHMLHSMGIETSICLDKLLEASALLEEIIEHKNDSYLLKAGSFDRKYPIPEQSLPK